MTKTTVTLTAADCEAIGLVRQGCEYAAWYTDWKPLPGTYEIKRRATTDFWTVRYYAEIDAVVERDYYGAHFGGVPVGKYDEKRNAGKPGKVVLNFTAEKVLLDARVSLDEGAYDAVLAEALAELKHEIDIQRACITSAIEPTTPDTYGLDPYSHIDGHCERLASAAKSYALLHGVKGRREYNAKRENAKQIGWDSKETHAKREPLALAARA